MTNVDIYSYVDDLLYHLYAILTVTYLKFTGNHLSINQTLYKSGGVIAAASS